MKPEIIKYCAWDVAVLHGLYNVYNAKLCQPGQAFWQGTVQEATKSWIKLSQSPDYDGQAESKVRGPSSWNDYNIERAIDSWNHDVYLKAFGIDDTSDDEHFDDYNVDDDDFGTARDCMGWEEDMIKNGEYF